jgi:hypothetical protein
MAERKRLGQIDLFTKRVRADAYRRSASEFQLTCAVADVLRTSAASGWLWTHFPAGEERPNMAGQRLKRMGLQAGWPDFILLPPALGPAHFLELKKYVGGVTSDEQLNFEMWAVSRGYPYVRAVGFEPALSALRDWGALRGLH